MNTKNQLLKCFKYNKLLKLSQTDSGHKNKLLHLGDYKHDKFVIIYTLHYEITHLKHDPNRVHILKLFWNRNSNTNVCIFFPVLFSFHKINF